MQPKDLEQLRRLLVSGATMDDVESTSRYGLVDNERFTEQARRAYRMLWVWSAPRFSSVCNADMKHERAYVKLGKDAYYRRIARCNAIIARLTSR